MRKVKARVYLENEWKEVVGKFHRWGDTFEEFRESPTMQFTMAIIELADGRVVEARPSNIQFDEEGNEN